MKNLKVCFLILLSNLIFAQKNYFDNYEIKSDGLSKEGYLEALSRHHLKFNFVDLKKSPGANLPIHKELNYEKILNGGLNSFLFENKYYGDLSYYSLFSWGNFGKMDKSVLEIANNVFFPNKELLNAVYSYYAPEYKKAFTKLTVQEQQLYLSKLDISEKFVKYVIQGKNRAKYDAWLAKNKLENDRYITEFMERRVKKGHWKIADCYYWINKVKKDFEPLKKNEKIAANYYYIQEQVGDSLYLVMDHKCNLFFTDKHFNRCDDNVYKDVSLQNGEYFGEKANTKKNKIKPVFYDENTLKYARLSDSICIFNSGKVYKFLAFENSWDEEETNLSFESAILYDFKNRRVIRDSIILENIFYFGEVPVAFLHTIEKDNYGNKRKSDEQMMFAQFYLTNDKMPESVNGINPETFEEIRYLIFSRFEENGTTIAYYFSNEKFTILLDLITGEIKEFKGSGSFSREQSEFKFTPN